SNNVAPLSYDKSNNNLSTNNAYPYASRHSQVSLASSYGGNSIYSDTHGSIAEKPLRDGKPGQVMDSPRGWGVVVNDDRASSVYPESAVMEGDDDRRGTMGGSRVDDMSWLNLRQ